MHLMSSNGAEQEAMIRSRKEYKQKKGEGEHD
jgi:hypothetical protein